MGYDTRFRLEFKDTKPDKKAEDLVISLLEYPELMNLTLPVLLTRPVFKKNENSVRQYYDKMKALIEKFEKAGMEADISTLREAWMNDVTMKWYDAETDLKILSKEFPTVLFTLRGDGENSGDMWVRYFLGGRVQYAQAEITYPKFDESKLE